MQPEYLARLSDPVKQFVHEIQEGTGLAIAVIPDSELDTGGTSGQGQLEVVIDASRLQIFVPTNGYFPNGAVRHELLHIQRFHIEGVPKVALADSEAWDKYYADALTALDNAIEHVIIVPVEIQLHPERRAHWEAVLKQVCSGLSTIPEGERRLAVCMNWAFLRYALPNSPQINVVRDFMVEHALLDTAEHFANEFLAASSSKEEMVRILFYSFPEIPRNRAALEYVSSITGRRQTPIP